MNSLKPFVSIITVTYNAEEFIERTLISIAEQTYPFIQSIIIDGESKDNTLEIVEKYKIKNSIVQSEPDRGLYDAMNKGIDMASGDYIIFMNAGDEFYEHSTLEKVFENWEDEDFIYGDTAILDVTGREKPMHKPFPRVEDFSFKSFRLGMVICHQSMFIKRKLAEEFQFEESIKIACDLEWIILSLKNCKTFKRVDFKVSKFLEGGYSQSNRDKVFFERLLISLKYFGVWDTIIFQCQIIFHNIFGFNKSYYS